MNAGTIKFWNLEKRNTQHVHTHTRQKTITPTSRCSASNGVLHCPKSQNNLNDLGTIRHLILMMPYLDIIHQVVLVMIVEIVCLRSRVPVFLSGVCRSDL